MQRTTLGQSGVEVSRWSLGTMTFGAQTPESEAHAQMDRALAAGITFWDVAEMYPVNPIRAETVGDSERIIGTWLAARGGRDQIEIATKITGPNGGFMRNGAGYSGANIRDAVDESLKRLQTDVIDLYQLHWPTRGSFQFRQNWAFDPSAQDKVETLDHMADVLQAMEQVVKAGKVRAFGLSNESAWGTARWIDMAEKIGAPRVASVQNEYSLMCRMYDTDMAEMAVNEGISLLAFSPLATGLLTGKYQNGARPTGSRAAVAVEHGAGDDPGNRFTERAFAVVDVYLALARKYGVDPVHMALAWCDTRPFHTIPIFGATRLAQLDHIIAGADVVLPDELVQELDEINRLHPMPY